LGQAKTKSEPEDQELAVFFTGKTRVVSRFFEGGNDLNWLVICRGFMGVLELNGIGSFACFLLVCVFFGLLYLLAQNY